MKGLSVTLRRIIQTPRATVTHTLKAGNISILEDADGDNLSVYLPLLSGKKSELVVLENSGQAISGDLIATVGFEESFAENGGIASYLRQIGVPEDSLSAVMEAYDLSRLAYLSCPQLPAVARRQLSLLSALRSAAPILVLHDPFQPFSGRWREQFAEEILENARSQQRCVIVSNLSFMPQCWGEMPEIQRIDLKAAACEAIAKAIGLEQAEKERKLREERLVAATAQKKAAVPQPNPLYHQPPVDVPKIENYAYRQVHDYIFAPLAAFCNLFRTWSGALAAICLVVLVSSMAYVCVPALLNANTHFGEFAAAWRAGMEPEKKRVIDAEALLRESDPDAELELEGMPMQGAVSEGYSEDLDEDFVPSIDLAAESATAIEAEDFTYLNQFSSMSPPEPELNFNWLFEEEALVSIEHADKAFCAFN